MLMTADGNHAMYMETRWNDTSKQSASHGVFLLKYVWKMGL